MKVSLIARPPGRRRGYLLETQRTKRQAEQPHLRARACQNTLKEFTDVAEEHGNVIVVARQLLCSISRDSSAAARQQAVGGFVSRPLSIVRPSERRLQSDVGVDTSKHDRGRRTVCGRTHARTSSQFFVLGLGLGVKMYLDPAWSLHCLQRLTHPRSC